MHENVLPVLLSIALLNACHDGATGADVDAGLLDEGKADRGCTAAAPETVRRLLGTAQCPGCCLRGADLRNANLSYADVRQTDLRCADMGGANWLGATAWGADARGAWGSLPGGARRDESGQPLTVACAGRSYDVQPNLRYQHLLQPAACGGLGAPVYEHASGGRLIGRLPGGARVQVWAPDTQYQRAKVQVVSGGCDRSLDGRWGWLSYTHLLAP